MSKETNVVVSSNGYTQSDQVDLIDIIQQVWAGKKTIAIFVGVCVVIAALYAFLAPQKWSSVAIVTLPDSGQVVAYSQVERVLYPDNPPKIDDIQTSLFSRFKGGLAALSLQLQNQEKPENLTSVVLNPEQPDQLKISYTGASAQAAKNTLDDYLKKIDSNIVTGIDSDLNLNIKSRSEDLKGTISSLEKVAQEKKSNRLNILNQALLIAQHANIDKPMLSNSTGLDDDTLFAVGSEALNAMIANYKNAPLPLDKDYYKTVQNLLSVQSLNDNKRIISTFRYIMEPSIPVHRDSPKRALILVISVLLGGILGSTYVLIRNAFRARAK
ncbi:LPS O-antigen chain length determinant protein WzzB [Mangrovibacter phragmitis]|uniref:LPS O-antigen chain length determinant protein WzzB n=1 Tax=Mangrovibacter phragmitis TaxID=1691903 RepID=UPI003369E9BC